jgi:flagellar motor switch protein FliM
MSSTLQEPTTEPEGVPKAEETSGANDAHLSGDAHAEEAAAHPEQAVSRTRVQALDFSQPTKFTAELRRRIGRVLTPFCKALSTRMTADLRAPVEVREIDANQLSWSAARSALPEDCLLVSVQAQPIGRQMLLALELPLVLRSLDCLLGGTAADAPQSRKLSEIDWALTRRLLDAIVLQLSPLWRDLGGLELSVGEVDVEGDAGVVVPIGEPTFAVSFEWEIAGLSSTFSLLLPWSAIEPVAEDILGGDGAAKEADPGEAAAVHRGLAAAKVTLRAEVGTSIVPVERVFELEPGSLLKLDARAEHGVTLLAENVPIGHGLPGRSGVKRAIKLATPIEPSGDQGLRAPLAASMQPAGAAVADRQPTLEGLSRLRGVDVRVWAELGRTAMSLSAALKLPQGTVIELDQGAEEPVELFVNGLPFATGTLATTAEGEWAIQIGSLI